MARFQVIAVAIFITIMLLLSIGMSAAIPKPIQEILLSPAFYVVLINIMAFWCRKEAFRLSYVSEAADDQIPRREKNAVADSLARQAVHENKDYVACLG
ncbi:hypothetical protein POTOM_051917 [Populus tomentosa]|uniref:Uncharacterized protein n=1 Tax=Populus tomentosa TaxID=118781 RepID=A0A8X7Y2J1_POPTO|nr:hypothetical protein POTOM_051917 [Populus tomentosa]